jgi:hypothetical protein
LVNVLVDDDFIMHAFIRIRQLKLCLAQALQNRLFLFGAPPAQPCLEFLDTGGLDENKPRVKV